MDNKGPVRVLAIAGHSRGNLRVRFSALWGALLQTLERKYRFTASTDRRERLAALECADVGDRGAQRLQPLRPEFQYAGPHPHAQGAGEATTCGGLSLQQITS